MSSAIEALARRLGLEPDDVEPRGRHALKIRLDALRRAPRGKLVLVTSMSPTAHGEGKTLTTIGLAMALQRRGLLAIPAIRQPSLGPVFGLKGGATGGGAAQVVPGDEINLHFTGDIHAVVAAQDLIAAMVDAHVLHGNAKQIDPARVLVPRTLDLNDRQLRHVVDGLGGAKDGVPRQDGFVIAAASEVMAILSLATDYADLKRRLGAMVVALDRHGKPVTAADVGATGSAAALLRDAMMPNLVLTSEGGPALVHAGPFANVSHGTSSVVADRVGLALADVVVTECGFGSELGAEKFVDIVCAESGLAPQAGVVVASLAAIHMHGLENLWHHVDLVTRMGLPVVVALNRFPSDPDDEVDRVLRACAAHGVRAAPHTCHRDGGAGGLALADEVLALLDEKPPTLRPLYAADAPFDAKIAALAHAYGASGVHLEKAALESLARLRDAGLDKLPVCVAKTPLSLSDDPAKPGVPKGWTLTVRDVHVHAGAGYLVALAGEIVLMPGLGASPAALRIDLTDDGRITGLPLG